MVQKYSDLNPSALDALQELGNIGIGNAIRSLASMSGRLIDMDIPTINIIPFQEAPTLVGGAETIKAGILLKVQGEISGMFLCLLDNDVTKILLEELLQKAPASIDALDEMSLSALGEVGNILCCSYINALSNMLDFTISISVPSVSVDMAGALLSIPIIEFADHGDELMFIEHRFHFDQIALISHILFLPEIHSLNALLHCLGISHA